MDIQTAIDIIESCSGFTDESTPVGEAWNTVLSYLTRTVSEKNTSMSTERESELNFLMQHIPPGHRYRWCTAGACACMGCVNGKLLSKGFTQKDHQMWVSKHPRGAENVNATWWIQGDE
jgi:hypothetical protein